MNTSVVSVGIDVSKAKLDVACMHQDRTMMHQVFGNDVKGIRSLRSFLKQQRTAAAVPWTLESTGAYHLLVALSLSEAGYRVNCVNPIITKKYMKATFVDRDQLVAFVGLDVRTRQSGQWTGRQVISKRGNGYLRKVLFQIGWGLMINNEEYQSLYQAMRARGKNYKTCIIALARKFLRFLFAFYWKRTIVFETSPVSISVATVRGVRLQQNLPAVLAPVKAKPFGCLQKPRLRLRAAA